MKPIAFVYGISCLVVASLWAAIVGFTGVLPFIVLPRGKRERYTIRVAAFWAQGVVRGILFARPRITGEVALRDPARGALFVSNHRSWLDPVLLIAHTHSQGLGKALIKYIPFVGFFGWMTGAVFFERSSAAARKGARDEVLWMLKQGARIHMFPEGTRTRTGEVPAKVHLVLPMDCWEAKIPVVPCAVWGTERTLPVDHTAAYAFQPSRLDIGRPLYPEDFPDGKTFADAVWKDVLDRIDRLRSE